MIVSRILYTILSLLLVTLPGFSAVPVKQTPDYEQALPGYQYHFPQDHAAHPSYKTEWWYYTGHLKSNQGRTFGYELTFFRIGTGIAPIQEKPPAKNKVKKSPWSMDELYMAHFALTDDQGKNFFNTETLNRAGLNTAKADSKTYHVVNKGWQVKQTGQDEFELFAQSGEQALHLNLKAEKPLVIHGKDGVSQKADCIGCASHYYSYTRLLSEGTLTWKGEKFPVKGHTWMDHEFGSNQLTTQQVGWDWFSVQLDDNSELMLYQLRQKNGAMDTNSSGTWVSADGKATHLKLGQFQSKPLAYWKSSKTSGIYPSGWQVLVPEQGLDLQILPTVRKQELVSPTPGGTSYWEGRCLVSGKHNGKKVSGEAYVELTGYSKAFKQRI
jgi:predicted secreted hydrolase